VEFLKAFRELMDVVGTAVDGVGVLLVVAGMGVASWRFLAGTQRTVGRSYVVYRQDLARIILEGHVNNPGLPDQERLPSAAGESLVGGRTG